MKTIQKIKNKVVKKLYDKYNLPALFIKGDGEFKQGDATDQELFDLASNINNILGDYEIDIFYNEGHEYGDEEDKLNAKELFNFLQKEYWKEYEKEVKQKN